MNILYFIMAFVGGAGLAVQASVNSRLAAGIGGQPLIGSFISFAVGAVFLGIFAAFQDNWSEVSSGVSTMSWWKWLGGVIGAVFVFTTIFLAPKIGLTNMAFLLILGQLSVGLLIDGFGLIQMPVREIFWWKYLGLGIMVIGLVFFMFGDRLAALAK
ncbi:DMT family transporter [Pasteurellaceae bacterium LIM206]|nr:DMT family transporter [Pasteurellaceae bacterium LIM206]